MYRYYIPFYYLVLSRLKSKIDILSWIIIFIIPPFFISFYLSEISFLKYVVLFTLGIVAFYSLYEIGYLENDIQTTKKEKKPTIRISPADEQYLENNYYKVILVKYLTVAVLVGILFLFSDSYVNVVYFLGILLLSRFFFYLHNTIRSRANISTFFGLSITKYIAILFLIYPIESIIIPILFSIVVFPLLRTMEHASRKKYNLSRYMNLIGNHDYFRVKYYIFFISISMFLYLVDMNNNIYLYSMFIFAYFLLFRYTSLLLVKSKIYKRDNLKRKDIKH